MQLIQLSPSRRPNLFGATPTRLSPIARESLMLAVNLVTPEASPLTARGGVPPAANFGARG